MDFNYNFMKNEKIEEILKESNNVLDISDVIVAQFLREKLTEIYEQGKKDDQNYKDGFDAGKIWLNHFVAESRKQLLDEIMEELHNEGTQVLCDESGCHDIMTDIIKSKYNK